MILAQVYSGFSCPDAGGMVGAGMTLEQTLAIITRKHDNPEISVLVSEMLRGNLSVRKQLASMIAMQPALLPPMVLIEISRWGVHDELSQCAEIRALA
jgi:type II secretory pathway component PulF